MIFLLLWAPHTFGSMVLVGREMFQGVGTLTSSNTDSFQAVAGVLNKRFGGPRILPATNGFSMDNCNSTSNNNGQFILPTTATNYFLGCWFFPNQGQMAKGVEQPLISFNYNNSYAFAWLLTNGALVAAQRYGPQILVPLQINQWQWIGLAISNNGSATSTNWDVRFYTMPLGGSLTNCASLFGSGSFYQRQQVNEAFVNSVGAANQSWNGRIGAPSLYSIAGFSDIAYPAELIAPVTPQVWFVNSATGNDTNTGAFPDQAWKSTQKIDDESASCGLFPANSYTNGDTLLIDTSLAPLDLTATNLVFRTRGLNVMATNSVYWTNLVAITLVNSNFTLIGSNTYRITMTNVQPNITVWESDKWMNHPQGASWVSVSNSIATNAGSFWTDGTNIYIHPFGDTSPASDGKIYTRSIGYGAAISLAAMDMNFRDCYAGKTAMIVATNNADGIGAYVVGTASPFGGVSMIVHCYLYYGSKHILGLVASAANSYLTVKDVQCEQCPPYVSCSAWVSYMSGLSGESNNIHQFINCRTDMPVGQIGSVAGTTTGQSIMYMHNSSSGVQFSDVIFNSCQMNGQITLTVCSNLFVTNCVFGSVLPSAVASNIIVNTKFTGGGVGLQYNNANNTIVQNCIDVETNLLVNGQQSAALQGKNVTFRNNTFDFSGYHSPFVNASFGIFLRYGPLTNFSFINNIVINNGFGGTNQFAVIQKFTSTDTCYFSNNLYVLGTSNWMATSYTNGSTATNLTFAQWQARGIDAKSIKETNPNLASNYIPQTNSAAIGNGLNLSSSFTTDYAGNNRPATGNWTIGAFEGVSIGGGGGGATSNVLLAAFIAPGTLALSWSESQTGWILQWQTNDINTGFTTNWIDVIGSGTFTQTNINVDPAIQTMFFRLRSP